MVFFKEYLWEDKERTLDEKLGKYTFLDIPNDSLDIIFEYLPLKDLLKVERVNHNLKSLVSQSKIWKKYLYSKHKFSIEVITSDYKQIFMKTFAPRVGIRYGHYDYLPEFIFLSNLNILN